MKKTFLKIMLVPALCTALASCNDTVSASSNSESNSNQEDTSSSSDSETTSEITSEISSETSSETSTESSSVDEEDPKDQAVMDLLDAYKEGNLLEEAFSNSFSMLQTSHTEIDAEVDDKISDMNDMTWYSNLENSLSINSFMGDESNLFVDASVSGDVAFTEYDYMETESDEEEPEEEPEEPEMIQFGLDTDLDLNGRMEIGDATYITAEGKLPSTNIQPVDEMTEETPEELEARSNFSYEGYSEIDYIDFGMMIESIINDEYDMGDEEEPMAYVEDSSEEEEMEIPSIIDLNDQETYDSIYNFLTGKDNQEYVTTSVELNTDETITLNFEVELDKLSMASTVGKILIAALVSEALEVDISDYLDNLNIEFNGMDNMIEASLTFDENYLPQKIETNVNLDETEIELKMESVDEENEYDENVMMTLDKFNSMITTMYDYGDNVEKIGFTDEEKEEIEENGNDITEYIEGQFSALNELINGEDMEY